MMDIERQMICLDQLCMMEFSGHSHTWHNMSFKAYGSGVSILTSNWQERLALWGVACSVLQYRQGVRLPALKLHAEAIVMPVTVC